MNKERFLHQVSVIDTETTHLLADQSEIVEVAGARYNGISWQPRSLLLGAVNGIPPEASAKNNISQRMIDGKPTFAGSQREVKDILGWDDACFLIAHNCQYDQEVLMHAWARCNSEEDTWRSIDRSQWICTHRLSKHLLHYDFPDMQYNLSYLRYRLDLPVSDDLVAHRAQSDVMVCAALLETLLDYAIATNQLTDGDDFDQSLHELCWKPIISNTWPFGKHRGKKLSEIETDYFLWAVENMDALDESNPGYDPDLAASVAGELEKRL